MKRGFQGAPRPLLPSMLLVATNPIAGQGHAAQAQSQPSPTPPPIPTSPPPPIPSPTPPPIPTPTPPTIPTPPPIPTSISPPPPPLETEPTTDEHIYEEQSPIHHHFSPSQAQAPSHMPIDDLLQTVPKLISRIDSLELDLKQTKLTMGNAIVKLVNVAIVGRVSLMVGRDGGMVVRGLFSFVRVVRSGCWSGWAVERMCDGGGAGWGLEGGRGPEACTGSMGGSWSGLRAMWEWERVHTVR
ncbi:hypothetical protein Tco_0291737 [Tanacetum coccineum]